jgi:intein/homing endonuclease
VLRVFQREGVRAAGIEPDIENVVHLLEFRGIELGLQEARAVFIGKPRIRALFLEGFGDALVDALVVQRFRRCPCSRTP